MKRLALSIATLALAMLAPAGASGAVVWNLDIHHHPTNFISTPGSGGAPGSIETVTVNDGAAPSTDEVQQIRKPFATGGTYRLSLGANTTPNLAYDSNATTIQTALAALPSIGAGNVKVSGNVVFNNSTGDKFFTVTFAGALAGTDVAQLTAASGNPPLTLNPQLWIDVENVGTSTAGEATLTVKLPNGLTRAAYWTNVTGASGPWSCPGSPGDTTVTCTTTTPIPRHYPNNRLAIEVNVKDKISGTRTVSAKLSGSGEEASASEAIPISEEAAPFGLYAPSFVPDFLAADGLTIERVASGHPERLIVPFDLSSANTPSFANLVQSNSSESLRDLVIDLPPGFVGNPTAIGECSEADFVLLRCPRSSQIGRIAVYLAPIVEPGFQHNWDQWHAPVFNLTHPRGAIVDLGFSVAGNPVHIKASLDPANHYAIRTTVSDINETFPPFSQRFTAWGVPADHSHDSERCTDFNDFGGIPTGVECEAGIPAKPFISLPAQCEEDNTFRIHHYDSWQDTGDYGPEVDYTIPGKMTDCHKPRFEPDVEIEPTGKQSNTPTGLDVHVKVAQTESTAALSTPPVKRFTVTLPKGMSFSPSFADGLDACTLAQMRLGTNDAVQCPDASRIGEVTLHSPLLPKSLEGSMFLAAQGDNPFGSTFALLLVLHDVEERGVLVKIPGRIDVDEQTGQIVTVFQDTPQFPFDDLTLKFRSGPRAPLVSPPTCGTQVIGVEVASYAQPQNPVDASNTYEVTEGPNGTPCPPDSARRGFHPTFSGGTLNPVAGTYSPFLFRMSRQDDEQELSQVTAVLPPGLSAKIAGIPYCPEQAIDSISTELGTGRAELAHPACPAASQLGTVSAGLGAGTGPNYFNGKAYLAGPYKGAPLSLAVVAPGLAGPFDLGNVVVRTALHINPETAQARAVSDPFPTILHGVILRVRDVRLRMDRPNTTINPTNCSPMSVDGQITGVGGDLLSTADDSLFNTSSPFQVGSCGDLAFKPKLDFRLFGGTKRGSHPKFRATLTMPQGGANIKSASVALPRSEFLDQGHIKTICTRVQFAQSACPAGSIYGTVTAKTPLLDETLSGNLYLRSSSNPLPDIVVAFRGGRIDANLVGRVDSVNGGIRNTFDFVPDVPVTEATFNFFGGKKGLLVNSRDICNATFKATAKFQAQSGEALTLRPAMKAKCGKSGKAKKRKR